jgi:FdrA protein
VVSGLINVARTFNKPVVIYFIGYPTPSVELGNVFFATSLSATAELSVALLEEDVYLGPKEKPLRSSRYLRGLFSGGTLAYETLLALQPTLSPLYSNAPISDHQLLKDPLHSEAHTIIDLGDEFFMVGRLHPMIDNDLRIRRLRQEVADPEVGIILLDVVLGEGSHTNPADELAPVINEIKGSRSELEFIVIVVGTEDDPQDLGSQIDKFMAAGAIVFSTVRDAVNHINMKLGQDMQYSYPVVNIDQLTKPFAAINVGLESFYESLIAQGVQAIQVDWRPPAGGNERLAALLQKMKK